MSFDTYDVCGRQEPTRARGEKSKIIPRGSVIIVYLFICL